MISDVQFPKRMSLGTSLDQKHNRTTKRCLIMLGKLSTAMTREPGPSLSHSAFWGDTDRLSSQETLVKCLPVVSDYTHTSHKHERSAIAIDQVNARSRISTHT